jgi:hypothetical protein
MMRRQIVCSLESSRLELCSEEKSTAGEIVGAGDVLNCGPEERSR